MQSLRSSVQQQRAGCTAGATSTRVPHMHRSPAVLRRGVASTGSGGCGVVQQQQASQQRHGRDACIMRAGKGFGAKKESAGGATLSTGDCPCGSGRSYQACCGKYHAGKAVAESPEALLRSRFTAYKNGLVDYLVDTTHPENPEYSGGPRSYGRMVKSTARANEFLELKVGEQKPGANEDEAIITFEVKYRPKAPSEQGKSAATTTETSRFVRSDGKWLFRDAERERVNVENRMAKPTLTP